MPNPITSNKCKRIYPVRKKMDKYEQREIKAEKIEFS